MERISRAEAQDLGRRMQVIAVTQAGLDHDFCELVEQFDSGEGICWFDGIKSTAHYVAFTCSMEAGAARERVRVARALREMPRVKELFADGTFSYSKVREVTRLAGLVDEGELCDLAEMMTASQLARTVSAYRSAPGSRLRSLRDRSLTVHSRDDGMTRITVVLGTEEAALVVAALDAAGRRHLDPSDPAAPAGPTGSAGAITDGQAPLLSAAPAPDPAPEDPATSRVQALLDIAGSYLDAVPGEPADDHTLVVVHVNVDQLASSTPVPAGTLSPVPAQPQPARPITETTAAPATPDEPAGTLSPFQSQVPASDPTTGTTAPDGPDVPAGTLSPVPGTLLSGTCHVKGLGPIEAATAQRLVCTSTLLGALVDATGDVLHLGRTSRLATRAQRRALQIRDRGTCQFPSCHQTRHLDHHHVRPWSAGGATDLDNLLLLCRRHHTLVHEGDLRITTTHQPQRRFLFALPDGTPISDTWLADLSAERLTTRLQHDQSRDQGNPERIFPTYGGAGFSLHECVRVLFDIQLAEDPPAVAA